MQGTNNIFAVPAAGSSSTSAVSASSGLETSSSTNSVSFIKQISIDSEAVSDNSACGGEGKGYDNNNFFHTFYLRFEYFFQEI